MTSLMPKFYETFLGTNVRTGVGNNIIEEVVNLAGSGDLTRDEALARATGEHWVITCLHGQCRVRRLLTQRAMGIRGEEFRDTAQDPTLNFGEHLKKI